LLKPFQQNTETQPLTQYFLFCWSVDGRNFVFLSPEQVAKKLDSETNGKLNLSALPAPLARAAKKPR
jgi:hypothetical protein